MSDAPLRETVRGLLASHPHISISKVGHAAHAERYVAENGNPIGLEPDTVRFQNLWVRADSVDLSALADIDHQKYFKSDFHESKPNHNLFGEQAFKDADLVCFKVTTSWQAVRVISTVAGSGNTP